MSVTSLRERFKQNLSDTLQTGSDGLIGGTLLPDNCPNDDEHLSLVWVLSQVRMFVHSLLHANPPHELNGSSTEEISGVGNANSIYTRTLRYSAQEPEVFTIKDYSMRLLRVLVAFYYLMLKYPISFALFLVRYNMLWQGSMVGLLLTVLCYPIYPLAHLVLMLVKKVLVPPPVFERGNVFFMPPQNFIAGMLWDLYKALSPPTAQFMLTRGDRTAIAHSWWDTITTKDFWRRHLTDVGARVPLELGRWKKLQSGRWGIQWARELKAEDIVIKVTDESNGCGDAFLLYGEGPGMVCGPEAVQAFLEKGGYTGKEALILEWIRPAAGQEVHSLDFLTVARPDGHIELFTCLYWGDCVNKMTSHSTRGGYIVDVEREEIAATCRWYAPGFAQMVLKDQFSIGHKLPGVKAACLLLVEAHRNAMAEQPWLKMIGWDAMISHGGPCVFFEGNFAQMRLPRRVFLTWENMWLCIRQYT